MIPYTREAYELLHRGTLALAVVEENGFRVDLEYLASAVRKTNHRIERVKQSLMADEVWKVWQATYGTRSNIGSNEQLGTVLFDKMGFTAPASTEKGRPKTDEESLSTVDLPFVQDWLQMKTWIKSLSTYLRGMQREAVNGIIHPIFNLNVAVTYRGSCESPNLQNIPVRDVDTMHLVRRAFVPRRNRQIVELDYSKIEVCVAACYHKDPTMLDYLNDPTKDMHRDMAMECYMLGRDQVTDEARYCGKNMFVFPQFYGDYYIDCARSLWNAIRKLSLKRSDGLPLDKHLSQKGIRALGALDPKQDPVDGTFEAHLKSVERRFWERRFPVYAQWKKDWYEQYRRRGWIKTLTGFVCQGYMKKNDVINYPVQGSAFHCLLWALSRIVLEELKRRKMQSMVIGQIHDSLLGDVRTSELDDYLRLCQRVMVKLLMHHWPWLIVPMAIEAKVAPPGEPWSEVKKMKIPA